MDADRFDALSRMVSTAGSRRRAVATALGGALILLSLAHPDDAAVKKRCPPCKKRKKGKCKKKPDGSNCPGGICRRGVCQPGDLCPGQRLCDGECIPATQCCTKADCPAGSLCCNGVCSGSKLEAGQNCFLSEDCCSNYCQRSMNFNDVRCAATCRGGLCSQESHCCRGEPCLPVASAGFSFCGGCAESGYGCESAAGCCYSACTGNPPGSPDENQKLCASYPGGPCAKNVDCRSCNYGAVCTVDVNGFIRDICNDGVCGCPDNDGCCSDDECPSGQICSRDWRGLNGECAPIVVGP
jgi:hypothetical protein